MEACVGDPSTAGELDQVLRGSPNGSLRARVASRGPRPASSMSRSTERDTLRSILVIALVNLLFGIGFALIARDRLKADGPFASPAFPLVALHAGAVVMPVALYFYSVHPAWAWMYWVDPHKLAGVAVVP